MLKKIVCWKGVQNYEIDFNTGMKYFYSISYNNFDNPNGLNITFHFLLNFKNKKTKNNEISNCFDFIVLFWHYVGGQGLILGIHHGLISHVIHPLPWKSGSSHHLPRLKRSLEWKTIINNPKTYDSVITGS